MKTGCGGRSDIIYHIYMIIKILFSVEMSSPVLSLLLCLLLPNLLLAKTCCDEPQVRHLPMNYEDTVLVVVVVVADCGSPLSAVGSWNFVFCSFKSTASLSLSI